MLLECGPNCRLAYIWADASSDLVESRRVCADRVGDAVSVVLGTLVSRFREPTVELREERCSAGIACRWQRQRFDGEPQAIEGLSGTALGGRHCSGQDEDSGNCQGEGGTSRKATLGTQASASSPPYIEGYQGGGPNVSALLGAQRLLAGDELLQQGCGSGKARVIGPVPEGYPVHQSAAVVVRWAVAPAGSSSSLRRA